MHPGPVNRGVELAAEVIDSPQALIVEQVESGRRGADGGALRAAGRRHGAPSGAPGQPADEPRSRSPHEPPTRARPAPAARPPTVLIRGAHLLDPRAGARRPRRPAGARRRRSPRSASRAARARPTAPRWSTPRACTPSRPSSTRTCTCARPGARTRRTSTPAPAPRPPAATARSSPCPTPTRWWTRRSVLRSLRERARAEARIPTGFTAAITRGQAGEELTEMAELADAGAVGFTDDGLPGALGRRDAPGAPVPAARRPHARAARGGPVAVGRRRDARGRGVGAARAGRHPVGVGVDDGRPRLRAGRLRGRAASTSSTCPRARRSR